MAVIGRRFLATPTESGFPGKKFLSDIFEHQFITAAAPQNKPSPRFAWHCDDICLR
jgi:hypothetical protein